MSDASTREKEFLVIRRNGSGELESPKGGVWKIAYADFMTAMMAFFLVMWLINATSETTKTGVANYFNPIKLSDGMQLPKKGLQDPEEIVIAPEAEKGEPRATETAAKSKAPDAATPVSQEPTEAAPEGPKAEAERGAGGAGRAVERRARFSEDALFRDPYAILAAIAAEADGVSSLVSDDGRSGDGTGGSTTAAARESYGDPFDPSAWGAPAGLATAGGPGQRSAEAAAAVAGPDSTPQLADEGQRPEFTGNESAPRRMATGPGGEEAAGNSGQAAADAEAARLQKQLLQALEQAVASRALPNVTVEHADGGVLISLADQVEFGMFAIGSAEPLPETIAVMNKIAELLKAMPGKVVIRGHTDGRPFRSETYDNWRLSAARAHMAYHMLVHGGLDERRVERIEGYADRDLKLPGDPDAAENRRIDILVQQEEVRS